MPPIIDFFFSSVNEAVYRSRAGNSSKQQLVVDSETLVARMIVAHFEQQPFLLFNAMQHIDLIGSQLGVNLTQEQSEEVWHVRDRCASRPETRYALQWGGESASTSLCVVASVDSISLISHTTQHSRFPCYRITSADWYSHKFHRSPTALSVNSIQLAHETTIPF